MWARLIRRRQAEWMDEPDADEGELRRSLAYIRRINRWLGYTRLTLAYLRGFARSWPAGRTITIVDVATGSADLPVAISAWAKRAGVAVRMIGIDLHAKTLVVASEMGSEDGGAIALVRGDARRLPLEDASVDYAITSMFLHHLNEADAVAVLREMDRVARRGVIVTDLLRTRRAAIWIWLFTLTAGPMVQHDARASVAGAFDEDDMRRMLAAAGLGYVQYRHHFGHRFVAAGEKGGGSAECKVQSAE